MEYVSCALCGADNSRIVSKFGILNKYQKPFRFNNVICLKCGLVYMNPRPSQADYDRVYKKYEEERYGLASQEEAEKYIKEKEEGFDKRNLLDYLRDFLPVKPAEARVLDIGCAHGLFSRAVREHWGAEVLGVEPSERFSRAARELIGVPVFEGTLEEYLSSSQNGERFHLIILNHVFEHFTDPRGLLRDLEKLLADKGIVYIEVPDVSNFKKHVSRFFDYCHPFSYSPATLCRLAEVVGWKVIGRADTKKFRLQAVLAPRNNPFPAKDWKRPDEPVLLRRALRRKRIKDKLRSLYNFFR